VIIIVSDKKGKKKEKESLVQCVYSEAVFLNCFVIFLFFSEKTLLKNSE
jgi:hypothetical protein